MARINFEDRWWTGAHRKKLIKLAGSEEMADGIAAGWWRLAQEYWGNGRKPVPLSVFELIEAGPKLIEAKLAKVEANGVYASGAAEAFDWLNDRREAGRKGGKKSAERPRDAMGRLQKKPKQKPNEEIANPPYHQTSGSGSYSGSYSKEENTILPDSAEAESRRVFDFESLYKKFPRKQGTSRGMKICKAQVRSQDDYGLLSRAIDRYVNHCNTNATDPKFIKHFSTFMGEWRDWLEADTGTVSRPEAEMPEWKKKALEEEAGRNANPRI